MTTPDAAPRPIPVHIASANEGLLLPPAPRRRPLRNAVVMTRNMTAITPIVDLVPYDTNRLYILAQCGGNNIVVCTDISQAQDPANQVAGVPNPNGYLLTAGNTTPIKFEGCQRMWAVGNTFPSQITWVAIHEQAP
jgi:hypothetical protein